MIVCFVDIGEIVDHHSSSFLFIMNCSWGVLSELRKLGQCQVYILLDFHYSNVKLKV
jgi:hypothetical protein